MKYFNEIANLYTEGVLKSEKVLSESMPPFEMGDSPGGDIPPYQSDDYKAFTQPQYKSATRGLFTGADPAAEGTLVKRIVEVVGKDIVAAIEGAGGRVADNRQEMNKRAGLIIMKRILANGKPLFQGSHAQHLGRNVVEALIRAGRLKEIREGGGRGGRSSSGVSPESISFGDD